MSITTRFAGIEDLQILTKLFDQYRVFYKQGSDLSRAEGFVKERLTIKDSVFIICTIDGKDAGFTQLYSSFTSVGTARLWILNDLFVDSAFRQKGVASKLIEAVKDFAEETGIKRIILSTENINLNAQKLYEKIGFIKEPFFTYSLDF